jgi:MFS family permease
VATDTTERPAPAIEDTDTAAAAPTPPSPPSPWSPLRQRLFRALWVANLVSFVGTWIHEVGAAWLMTSLAPTPVWVAAVQAAAMLPMFLLVLPAGTLADLLDRRRLLLAAVVWMLAASGSLGALTLAGHVTPPLLLVFTALLAGGQAFAAPTWQSLLPEVVGREELPGAIALGSLSVNLARSVGPALGGVIVAAAGPGAAFLLNAVSFLVIVAVLASWRRPGIAGPLPAERLLGAMRTGLRYVGHAPRLVSVLVRSSAFIACGTALWALLPLLARRELGLGAAGYGGLLAVFGVGAVSAAAVLPRVRRRTSIEAQATVAALTFAATLGGLSVAPRVGWVAAAMFAGGAAWLTLLSGFQIAAQTVLPAWVRGRALAAYLLVFFGSMGLASLGWGAIATALGLRPALALAAVGAAASVLLRARFRLRTGEDLDLSPSRHWPAPATAGEIAPERGPVMITLEYRVPPEEAAEFERAMAKVRMARRRDGAYFWDLFTDAADPERYVEVYLTDSWLEHLRQHERVTEQDRRAEAVAREHVIGGAPRAVTHLLSVGRRARRG